MDRQSFMQWVDYMSEISHPQKLIDKLKKLDTEILFVSGEEDVCFIKGAKKIAPVLRNAKIALIKKCGHVCTIEKAKEFNTLALNFLQNIHRKQLTV